MDTPTEATGEGSPPSGESGKVVQGQNAGAAGWLVGGGEMGERIRVFDWSKTPIGPVEDVLAKPEDEVLPENRALLTIAHHNGLRLLKLVNTLLDFSRIEAGPMQAVYERTDIAALTSQFRATVERAGMRLSVNCPAVDAPVYLDRDMWAKIVLNLLSNAFKFTFKGEIDVRLCHVDGAVELTVRDTGVGIPASASRRRRYRLCSSASIGSKGRGVAHMRARGLGWR